MKKVAVIVEGKGDVRAVPSLIAKSVAAFGISLYTSQPPIKAGEARKLKRAGELERHLWLAASREDAQEIYVIVDLDDDCAKMYSDEFTNRSSVVTEATGKPIHFCFLVREYEVLFLQDIRNIASSMPELEHFPRFRTREGFHV